MNDNNNIIKLKNKNYVEFDIIIRFHICWLAMREVGGLKRGMRGSDGEAGEGLV